MSISYVHEYLMFSEYIKVHSIFRKILQTLPQTTASSPGYVAFLTLDGGEHGKHGDHLRPHAISQRQHGFERKLSQRTSINILG